MFRLRRVALCLAVLVLPALAIAALVIDQEQSMMADGIRPAIGGVHEQRLGQTVTAGFDGSLTHVELPVVCSSGTLIVEIIRVDGDLPGSDVRATAMVEAAALPPHPFPVPFVRIALDAPVRMAGGERFAIVMRNDTGLCTLATPVDGDTYPDGQAFFDALNDGPPRPRRWEPWRDSAGTVGDFAFRTVMDSPIAGRGGQCSVRGLPDPLPIPSWAPVCRCLQDPQAREQRCMLFHPSLMLMRRLPFPLKTGEKFAVRWTLIPFTSLKGTVEVEDHLPPEFTSSLKAPLWFFLDQTPPTQGHTLEYSAVAPAKGGTFRLETSITMPGIDQKLSTGTMRTTLSVVGAR